VKSMLAHALESQPLTVESDPRRPSGHDNIRGAGYYE